MSNRTLKSLLSDKAFDLFWEKVNQSVMAVVVNEPQVSQYRRQPRRYDDGLSSGDFNETPKTYYRQYYFETIDLIINWIQDRFDQPRYRVYQSLEIALIKAHKQEELDGSLKAVCTFYKDTFDQELLHAQLQKWVFTFSSSIQV